MDYNAFFSYGGLLLLGYVGTILIHEVGHYLCYLQFGGKNNLQVKWGKRLGFPITFILDIDDVSKDHHNKIIWCGIATGAVFIYYIAFIMELYFFGLLFFPYILGIQHDIRSLQNEDNVKGKDKK